MKYIKNFKNIGIKDIDLVGGKNASLGEMIRKLASKGIKIPDGFAITSQAYWHFLQENQISKVINKKLNEFSNYDDINKLEHLSSEIRNLIENSLIPSDLELEITNSFNQLVNNNQSISVAVRSSATAEDLPSASFAGQQETFLNISDLPMLLACYKQCISSLFTARAIAYRKEHNFDHFKIGISVGIQKMVRSDIACSGVSFTLDPETGFKDVIYITSSYGLGESVVQGIVNPDSFYVHKPTLQKGFIPILKKELGSKKTQIIFSGDPKKPTAFKKVPDDIQNQFSLSNDEIIKIAKLSLIIEQYYSKINNKWIPMDIEWAKDGFDNQIYILQARYETVHSNNQQKNYYTKYFLKSDKPVNIIAIGCSIGQKIACGRAKVIEDIKKINTINQGDIIVTKMTDPDWVPMMKKAAGIITNQGGRTCHAAIVSRELGIPAIVGTNNATELLKNDLHITMDCSQGEIGNVYEGIIPFEEKKIELEKLKKRKRLDIMLNIGSPDQAFTQSFLPTNGVGLARLEFIISNSIKIHPMALIKFDELKDLQIKKEIESLTQAYGNDKKQFFIDKLAEQAGTIAAAFYPRPVIIRLSDFKSNEYRNLIGGSYFEPQEENPMIGLRGASRYYSTLYQEAFTLECEAIKKIIDQMGLSNIKIMIPFVRTVEEAKKVITIIKDLGLKKGNKKLEVIMMCEIPSNIILIEKFSKFFDGFSIGSNDLTQLTLAIDRDSSLLSYLFDERDESIKQMLKIAISGAKRLNKPIGICGQAPSDYPEFAKFLIESGINSISLNPDSIIPFLQIINK